MRFTRGVMLEGISCAGKTSTMLSIRRMQANDFESERSTIVLGEHYTQILNSVNGRFVRMSRDEHGRLLLERLKMLEQLNDWACSLGEFRRRSRGLFAIFERFYLNHLAAFDDYETAEMQEIEALCNAVGLKVVLLVLSDGNLEERMKRRDRQMKVSRLPEFYQGKVLESKKEQDRYLRAAEHIRIPTLIVNTDAMDWDAYAKTVLSFVSQEETCPSSSYPYSVRNCNVF